MEYECVQMKGKKKEEIRSQAGSGSGEQGQAQRASGKGFRHGLCLLFWYGCVQCTLYSPLLVFVSPPEMFVKTTMIVFEDCPLVFFSNCRFSFSPLFIHTEPLNRLEDTPVPSTHPASNCFRTPKRAIFLLQFHFPYVQGCLGCCKKLS